MPKMKIKVREGHGDSLQESFESLQNCLGRISPIIGSRYPMESLWGSIIDIQDGASNTPYGTADEIAENLERKQELINEAFSDFFEILKKYRK